MPHSTIQQSGRVRQSFIHLAVVLAVMLVGWQIAEGKSGRTYFTDAEVSQARQLVKNEPWAKKRMKRATESVSWLMDKSDEALWKFVPPVQQLRSLRVSPPGAGCPVHGKAVYKKGGNYPWIMDREHPFKVQCPVGKERYPSNDFKPWPDGGAMDGLDTHQKYVDDGTGYIAPDGKRYFFVGHYIFWQRWQRDIMRTLDDLRNAYLLTGEQRYGHKAAVLLARIAAEYPDAHYSKQAAHKHYPAKPRHTGGIFGHIWENLKCVKNVAKAYDAVYPIFEKDASLRQFLASKGIDEPRRHIEHDLLANQQQRLVDEEIRGNFGMPQRSMALLALVLDNQDPQRGLTTKQAIDWLMWGGGNLKTALWNRFYRNGPSAESSPQYGAGSAKNLSQTAALVQQLGYDIFANPMMTNVATEGLDLTVLGKHPPSTGDAGSIFGMEPRRGGWTKQALGPVYQAHPTPRLAKALSMIGVDNKNFWDRLPVDPIQAAAKKYGPWPHSTHALDGYGMAIAESPDHDVGLSMYYGYAGGGHGHYDRLNMEMFAFDRPILPDMGYPKPLTSFTRPHAKRFNWTSATISHYGVTVNRKEQTTRDHGRLRTLVQTPAMQVIDASAAEVAYPEITDVYGRTSLLIEQPGSLPYLLNIFRVTGGDEHVWSFHGPPMPEFQTDGLDFGPVQKRGTLAGEDVEFGGKPPKGTERSSGFAYLENVRRAQAPDQPWTATWRDPDADENVRLRVLPGSAQEIVSADSEPELIPNTPDDLPYLLAFHKNQGDSQLRSNFVSTVEPFKDKPGIQAMERLEIEGPPHAVGVVVQRDDGRDYVLSHRNQDDQSQASTESGKRLILQGRLALLSTMSGDDGRSKLRTAVAVDAKALHSPWFNLSSEPMSGRLASVDYQANTVTLNKQLAADKALEGRDVFVGNEDNHTVYEIRDVTERDGRTVLHFGDVPLMVGVGHVDRVDASAGRIVTDTKFTRKEVYGGKHKGRWLVNQSRQQAYRIASFEDQKITLKSGPSGISQVFNPDVDEKNRFWIASMGRADHWRIPAITYVARTEDQTGDHGLEYELRVTSPVNISLPMDEKATTPKLTYRADDGTWQPLETTVNGNAVIFSISPDQLKGGRTRLRIERD